HRRGAARAASLGRPPARGRARPRSDAGSRRPHLRAHARRDGAEVLKISGQHLPHSGEIEIDTGLGKRAAFLDLREARDIATLAALIRDGRSDVFSQSYRPGTLAARGFGAEELAALRPGIVAVELSAWGGAGPWAARRGFDTIVQCASGMAMIEGGDKPRLLPVSAIDYVSGYLMAMGAMVALLRRAREGGSWR